MKIQKSVKKAIDEMAVNDFESAMIHVCSAIDGTARKKYPDLGSNARFTEFIRSHYDLLGVLVGMPFIDWNKTRWPITVERPKADGGTPDLADMIYGIHRCMGAHGEELPEGFEFVPDIANSRTYPTLKIQQGAIGLSDSFIWALIVIVVLDPINLGIRDDIIDGYYLMLGGKKHFINEWWGRLNDLPPLPQMTAKGVLDFSQLS